MAQAHTVVKAAELEECFSGKTMAEQNAEEEPPKEPQFQPEPCGYFQLYCTADKLDYLMIMLGLVGACGGGILLPLFAIVFGDFIDAFGDPTSVSDFTQTIANLSLSFLYLAIGGFIAMYLEVTFFVLAGERQTNRLRAMYLAAVLRQDIAFFDTSATTGGLLQGLNEDSINIQSAISEKASNFIHHMSTFISGFAIAFTFGWDMTLVMIGCLPFLAIMGMAIAKVSTGGAKVQAEAYAQASTIAQQSISSVRTVAAYNGQHEAIVAYEQALEKPVKRGVIGGIKVGGALGGIQFVMYCSYAVALIYGAYRIVAGKYTGGDVVKVQIATLMASFALGQAAPNLQAFGLGRNSGGRMFYIINRKPKLADVGDADANAGVLSAPATASSKKVDTSSESSGEGLSDVVPFAAHNGTGELEKISGRVEFVDVHFCYPARLDVEVFKGFNLVVPAGHTVALVGASGSGKSTAVQLIERFYDPHSGSVTLDGVDLRALKLSWLRSHIGLVSQEPTLFATTIFDNIALGKQGASKEEVMAAAEAANAHKFINLLPEGYDTQVGEKGIQLSGGQKQRIAIARAILKNPQVLLLDEATSALDTQSERVVQAALDRMVVGRTTVVVAHRLSTIKHANAIAVVSNGTVAEVGTHDQLISKPGGAYSLLVQMQMQAGMNAEVANQTEDRDPDDIDNVAPTSQSDARPRDGRTSISRLSSSAPPGETGPGSALKEVIATSKGSETHSAPVTGMVRVESKKELSEKEQEALDEAKAKEVPMSRLLELNRPEWPLLGLGCVASVAYGLQHPALAFVFSDMITIFYLTDFDELKKKASFYAWMFFVIGVGALISGLIQQACLSYSGARLALRVRVLLLKSLLRQEIAFFDEDAHSSGRLTSALATDAAYIRGAVADAFAVGLQNLSTLALGYVIAFAYNWQMALVVTGTFPVLAMAMVLQMRWATGASSTSDSLYAGANQYITEAFSSIRIIHAYNLQSYITNMYAKMLDSTRPTLTKQAHMGGLGMGFSFSMMFLLYALIVWFGGWQITHDQTDMEGFLKGFLAILLAAMGMAQAGAAFPDMGKAKGAVGRVFPLLDRVPAIDPEAPAKQDPPSEGIQGEVAYNKVKFFYPSRPAVVIYNDFSLTIPAGKVYALVGESGSGKSTVVSLLERFYDPVEGTVTLDGVDIRNYNLKWLRQQIGLVSQEPILFAGTVADNIRYGRAEQASLEELESAARIANAIEFINKLPEGLNTRVGEGGIQLSGGQKQRIAIARAVMKNPKVLLLDEATSALDARSERVVQDALDSVMTNRTCLVIAHRLSTIKNAHAISVLYRGSILEQGTHSELMAIHGGAYAKLVAAQEKAHSKAKE